MVERDRFLRLSAAISFGSPGKSSSSSGLYFRQQYFQEQWWRGPSKGDRRRFHGMLFLAKIVRASEFIP
jgi:hypothetical protein